MKLFIFSFYSFKHSFGRRIIVKNNMYFFLLAKGNDAEHLQKIVFVFIANWNRCILLTVLT